MGWQKGPRVERAEEGQASRCGGKTGEYRSTGGSGSAMEHGHMEHGQVLSEARGRQERTNVLWTPSAC